jgi:hypothetical protein
VYRVSLGSADRFRENPACKDPWQTEEELEPKSHELSKVWVRRVRLRAVLAFGPKRRLIACCTQKFSTAFERVTSRQRF